MRQHRNKPRRKLSSVSLSADVTNQITDPFARSFFYIYISISMGCEWHDTTASWTTCRP